MAARLTAILQRHGGRVADAAPQLQRYLERLRRALANLWRQGRLDDDMLGWVQVLAAIVHDVDGLQQEVEKARAAACRQPRVLAPVGADPMRESLTQFRRRATNHWHARAEDVDTHRAASRPDPQGGLRQSRAVAAHPMARALPGPQGIV